MKGKQQVLKHVRRGGAMGTLALALAVAAVVAAVFCCLAFFAVHSRGAADSGQAVFAAEDSVPAARLTDAEEIVKAEYATTLLLILIPLIVLLVLISVGMLIVMRKNVLQIKFRDEKFRIAIGQLSSILFEYDIQNNVSKFLNSFPGAEDAITNMTLHNPEILGPVFGEITQESRAANREMYRKIRNGAKNASCQLEVLLPNGGTAFYEVSMTGVQNKNGVSYYALGMIDDVTDKVALERMLHDRANHDQLTGLLNRASFESAVTQILENADTKHAKHAFLVCDIDNFKQVNDTYGHLTGDVALKKVANLLTYVFGTQILGRFGGDEFLVFLSDISSVKNTIFKVRNVCEEMDNLLLSDDIQEKFNLSIGLAFAPADGIDFEELYRKADSALYRAKHFSGNSFYVYDSFGNDDAKFMHNDPTDVGLGEPDGALDLFFREMQSSMTSRKAEVSEKLQKALENNEIELYIQPKFATRERILESAEVLARWNSPVYGLLSPNRFIPLYEKAGLMEEFDIYILRKACAMIKEWRERGLPCVPLSINQSPTLLLMRSYIDVVKYELEKNQIPPELLCIEITERAVFSSYRTITKVVQSLKELGITVSLDDFGSGYTSLNMLKNLYVGELKIDKQFIDRLSFQKERAHIIVKHIVSLAKEMGISTTMEGVETEEQAEFIASVGCDTLQGFLLSRPMEADAFQREYLGQK